ncbi:carboxypeptidase regulatory-like domain-containing protein [Myxococcus sp. K15C18031901]|uniref:carboxypeptidase regulatory-like domain-containing protein n=1 Tax=Myxococcus dinghuensis TaxID=2906761 RepID=UPI0020A6DC8D|nr:carboxypeptidase regulatory-like domain-containing protein [Myxococcus dinghuensis]MCP3098711.1 carboxypeptidase regulatory-like domain-containing protein [Myxococcus dinghuensis]
MTLRTLGLSMVGVVGLLALPACKKEGTPPLPPPTTPAPVAGQGAQVHEATPIQAPEAQQPAAPAGKGEVKGTVSFTGTPPPPADLPANSDPACEGRGDKEQSLRVQGGKLENVVVRIKGAVPGAPPAPTTPVVVDQSKCTYVPRVQGAVAGQSVMFKNSDGTLHNVRGVVSTRAAFNVAQAPSGAPVERKLPTEGDVLKLKCDIHPWMTAYIVSNPNPFFATTGADGAFSLKGLPAGTYTVEAWHETLGTKTAEVTVKDDAPATVDFAFSASDAPAKP